MRKTTVFCALLLVSITAQAATSEQIAAEFAANAAFEAADYCRSGQSLYEEAAKAFKNGISEGRIKEVSGADVGTQANKDVAQAILDAKSGSVDPDGYYKDCIESVKADVSALINKGGTL